MNGAFDLALAQERVYGSTNIVGGNYLLDGTVLVHENNLSRISKGHVCDRFFDVGIGRGCEGANVFTFECAAVECVEVVFNQRVSQMAAGFPAGRRAAEMPLGKLEIVVDSRCFHSGVDFDASKLTKSYGLKNTNYYAFNLRSRGLYTK